MKITSEIKPPFNKVQSVSEIDNVPHSFLLILVTGKIIGMKNWRAWISMFFTSTEWKNHGIRLWFAYNNAKPKHLKLGWIGCAIWLTNHKRIQLFFHVIRSMLSLKVSQYQNVLFEISNFPKIPQKIWQISALESKKWSDHKIKTLFYNTYDQICYLTY